MKIEQPKKFVTNGQLTFSFECSFFDDKTLLEETKTFVIEHVRSQELPFRTTSKAWPVGCS